MAGSSSACISPSTVQSTTSVLPASAATTGAMFCSASDAPVERACGMPRANTVGITRPKTRAPSRAAASRASSTSTGRLWLSLSTATVSPGWTAQRRSTDSKASSQAGSILSCNMGRASWSILHENSCKPC